MNLSLIEEQTFVKRLHEIEPFECAFYERCTFDSCDFSNANLQEFVFAECVFNNCNLSLAKLDSTSFRETRFDSCKMVGLLFHTCSAFLLSFSFANCTMHLSSFRKLQLKNMLFTSCLLHEVDFTEADLLSAIFERCDCDRAIFFHTNLEKADFRTSFNYSIHPEHNRVKKARFSFQGIMGLLDAWDIIVE